MKSNRRAAIALILLAGALSAACSDGTGPEARGEPGLSVVLGAGASDTIGAELAQALVVEVRDQGGRVRPGAAVTFEASVTDSRATATFARRSSGRYTAIATDTTDEDGRAAVLVRLGTRAGPAEVAISVPALEMQTTASFTVLPGAAATIVVEPADSALYTGNSYTLHGTVQDRAGNARSEPVSYTAGAQTVSVSGAVVRGERVGRGFVTARSGAVAATAWMSVVPPGVLAAYEFPTYYSGDGIDVRQPGRLVTLRTDGSEFRVILEQRPAVVPFSYAGGMHPAWAPSAERLAYVNDDRLWSVDLSGSTHEVFAGDDPVHGEFPPEYSADGQWIYFTRGRDGHQRTFWRVRPDGTDVQQVSPEASWGIEVMPSPDPTGTRVVYQTNHATNSPVDFTLRILDVGTGAVTALDVPGTYPRWSPRGDQIGYLDPEGRLRSMSPDGAESRLIGGGIGAHPVYSWSPDGEWVAISGNQPRANAPFAVGLSLVNISTGEVLPLRFNPTLVQPNWRP